MRILVVCQHYAPEPFNISEVCEGLVSLGHEVTVLTGLPNYPEGEILEEYRHGGHRDEVVSGVRVLRVPIVARGANLRGFNKIRRVLNYLSFPMSCWMSGAGMAEEYDCVLSIQLSPILMSLPALRIARKKRVPCLLWSMDLWPEDLLTGGLSRDGLPFKLLRWLSSRVYGAADALAVTSPAFERYFSEQLGLRDVSVEWLPQFAEEIFEQITDNEPSPAYEGNTVFTFAGNIGGNQSVETIIRAAAKLDAESVSVRIAGSGSRFEDCEAIARDLGAGNVEFLGRLPLERMPRVYSESDAMVLSLAKPGWDSLVPRYTIPRKFQSYLAASKPVICCAEGVVSEIVESERCGLSCPAEDVDALAAAMLGFTRLNQEQRSLMSERSGSLYRNSFSRGRFFQRLDGMLARIVDEKGIGK